MDYDYLPTSNGAGDAVLMHLNSDRLVGNTTLDVDSVVNVPAKFIATVGTKTASNFIDPATKADFKGHVSGDNLVIDAFEPGSTDTGNTEGQIVVIKPNTGWANRVATFIGNATGSGTPEDLTAHNLTVGNTLTVPNGAVGASALATNAVLLGYSQNVGSAVTASNSTPVDIPGASVTVTVPAGGRSVEIQAHVHYNVSSGNDAEAKLILYEGTTLLASNYETPSAGGRGYPLDITFIATPTAGSHTYKLSICKTSGGGNVTFETGTAVLIVKAV